MSTSGFTTPAKDAALDFRGTLARLQVDAADAERWRAFCLCAERAVLRFDGNRVDLEREDTSGAMTAQLIAAVDVMRAELPATLLVPRIPIAK